MNKYEVGDILENVGGNRGKVLGVCGLVYHISYNDDYDQYATSYTIQELDKGGYRKATKNTPKDDWIKKGKDEGWLKNGKVK